METPAGLVSYAIRLIHELSGLYPQGGELYHLGERMNHMRGTIEHRAGFDSNTMQILQDIIVDSQNIECKLKSYNLRVSEQQIQYDIHNLRYKIDYLLGMFRPVSQPIHPIYAPNPNYPGYPVAGQMPGYPYPPAPNHGGFYQPQPPYQPPVYPPAPQPTGTKQKHMSADFEEVNPAFDSSFKACLPADYSSQDFLNICADLGMTYDADESIPGKNKCADYIRERQREARGRTPPTTIAEARTSYTALSAELLKATKQLKELYDKIPQDDLTSVLTEKMKKLGDFEYVVKNPQCKLIVFGETNAGKSLFMNLLLEFSLLPSLGVAATSAVTELSYSDHGTLIVTNSESKNVERKHLDPRNNPDQQLKSYLVAQKEDRTKLYQPLVKIEWPSNILRAGITLVDSPGINENPELDEIVKSFLPDCSGVICVLDASAGGFTRAIQKMLSDVRNALNDHFNPSAFLFVCSKIDRVPERDRAQSMQQTKYNLTNWFANQKSLMRKDKKNLYPDFNAEEQTIFLNVFTSFAAVEYGLETIEYQKHKKKITSFIEKGYYLKFQSFYNQCWEYISPGDQLIKAMVTANKRVVKDIEAERKKTKYKNAVSKMNDDNMRPQWTNLMREQLSKLKNDLFQASKTIEIPKLMENDPLPKMSKVEEMQVEYAKLVRERWKNEFMVIASKLVTQAKNNFGEEIAASLTELYTALKDSENGLIGIKELWVEDIAQEVSQIVSSAQSEYSTAEKAAAVILGVPVAVAFGAAAVVVAALLAPLWAPIVGFTIWSDSKAVERAQNNPQQFKKAVYELVYTVPEAERLSNYFFENSKIESLFNAMLEKGLAKMVQLREDSEQIVKKKEQQSMEKQRKYKPLNTKMEDIQTDLYFIASILDEKLHNGKRGTYIPMRIEDTLKKNTRTFSKFPPTLDLNPPSIPEAIPPTLSDDAPPDYQEPTYTNPRINRGGVRVLPPGNPGNRPPARSPMFNEPVQDEQEVEAPMNRRISRIEQTRRPVKNERDLTRRNSVATYRPPAQIATADIDFNSPPPKQVESDPEPEFVESPYGGKAPPRSRTQSALDLREQQATRQGQYAQYPQDVIGNQKFGYQMPPRNPNFH